MSHDSLHLAALEDEAITETGLDQRIAPALEDLVHARPADAFAGWARIASQKADASCACWCRTRRASR